MTRLDRVKNAQGVFYLERQSAPVGVNLRRGDSKSQFLREKTALAAVNGIVSAQMAVASVATDIDISGPSLWDVSVGVRPDIVTPLDNTAQNAKAIADMLKSDEFRRRYPRLVHHAAAIFYRVVDEGDYVSLGLPELKDKLRDFFRASDCKMISFAALRRKIPSELLKVALRQLCKEKIIQKVPGGFAWLDDGTGTGTQALPSAQDNRNTEDDDTSSMDEDSPLGSQQPASRQGSPIDLPMDSDSDSGYDPIPAAPNALQAQAGRSEHCDPVSGFTCYTQKGVNRCLDAALDNLLGQRWAHVGAARSGTAGVSGELQLACHVFDDQGHIYPRMTPDNDPMQQLVLTPETLRVMAPLMPQLPHGFILYCGDTSREASASGAVLGHFMTQRYNRDKNQWYLINPSSTQGPQANDLTQFLRENLHGQPLMAGLPLSAAAKASTLWQTYQTMAAHPHIWSVCTLMQAYGDINFGPQHAIQWMRARGLDMRSLADPAQVRALLQGKLRRTVTPVEMRLPDMFATLGPASLDESSAKQWAPDAAAGHARHALRLLDKTGRNQAALCLKTDPMHVYAWRHKETNEWRCMVPPLDMDGNDALCEQPLQQVLQVQYERMAVTGATLPADRRLDPEFAERCTAFTALCHA